MAGVKRQHVTCETSDPEQPPQDFPKAEGDADNDTGAESSDGVKRQCVTHEPCDPDQPQDLPEADGAESDGVKRQHITHETSDLEQPPKTCDPDQLQDLPEADGAESGGVKRQHITRETSDLEQPPQDFPEAGSERDGVKSQHDDCVASDSTAVVSGSAAPRTPTALDSRLESLERQIRSYQADFRFWAGVWRGELQVLDSRSHSNTVNIRHLTGQLAELQQSLNQIRTELANCRR